MQSPVVVKKIRANDAEPDGHRGAAKAGRTGANAVYPVTGFVM